MLRSHHGYPQLTSVSWASESSNSHPKVGGEGSWRYIQYIGLFCSKLNPSVRLGHEIILLPIIEIFG